MISLKGNNLTAGYGGVDIISNINLYVNEGEIVVIIGPNGLVSQQQWKLC